MPIKVDNYHQRETYGKNVYLFYFDVLVRSICVSQSNIKSLYAINAEDSIKRYIQNVGNITVAYKYYVEMNR